MKAAWPGTVSCRRRVGCSPSVEKCHDIRVSDSAYRWSKLPRIFLRLKHNTVAEIVQNSMDDPDALAFRSSGALLEGTIFGGLYLAPILGSLSPNVWGIGASRLGQIIVYTPSLVAQDSFSQMIAVGGCRSVRIQLCRTLSAQQLFCVRVQQIVLVVGEPQDAGRGWEVPVGYPLPDGDTAERVVALEVDEDVAVVRRCTCGVIVVTEKEGARTPDTAQRQDLASGGTIGTLDLPRGDHGVARPAHQRPTHRQSAQDEQHCPFLQYEVPIDLNVACDNMDRVPLHQDRSCEFVPVG